MATEAYPTLNGMAPSWADVAATLTVGGGGLIETTDFSALNYGTTVEVGEQRGASGGRVMRRTTGAKTDEASFTFYKTGLVQLIRGLMASSDVPTRGNEVLIGLVHFDILVQQTPPGSVEIYTEKVSGCRLIGMTLALAEGTDATTVEVPVSVGKVAWIVDGKEIVLI